MGSSRAARMAGATPKIMPMAAENPNDNSTDQSVTEVVTN